MTLALRRVGSVAARLLDHPRLFDVQQRLFAREYRGLSAVFGGRLRGRHSVLDIGCGTGACAANLLSFATVSYCGVDMAPGYIDYASRRYPDAKFVCADAGRIDLSGQTFDAVLMFSILHHLDDSDARRLVLNVTRTLSPTSMVLAAEPLFPDPRHHSGVKRIRALISLALLRMDRGEHIRDQKGYRELWEGLVRTEEFTFKSGLHEFYGLVLRVQC